MTTSQTSELTGSTDLIEEALQRLLARQSSGGGGGRRAATEPAPLPPIEDVPHDIIIESLCLLVMEDREAMGSLRVKDALNTPAASAAEGSLSGQADIHNASLTQALHEANQARALAEQARTNAEEYARQLRAHAENLDQTVRGFYNGTAPELAQLITEVRNATLAEVSSLELERAVPADEIIAQVKAQVAEIRDQSNRQIAELVERHEQEITRLQDTVSASSAVVVAVAAVATEAASDVELSPEQREAVQSYHGRVLRAVNAMGGTHEWAATPPLPAPGVTEPVVVSSVTVQVPQAHLDEQSWTPEGLPEGRQGRRGSGALSTGLVVRLDEGGDGSTGLEADDLPVSALKTKGPMRRKRKKGKRR